MKEEIWKDIRGFPGYQVSNKGRVRSWKFPEPMKKPIKILETGEVFDSITSCAKTIGSSVINIVNAISDDVPDHHSCKGLHFELLDEKSYNKYKKNKNNDFLYDYQIDAVNRMFSGCILAAGVGTGKSRMSLYWYFKENGGSYIGQDYKKMKNPKNLYIITTALKRDNKEWVGELANFNMSNNPEVNPYDNKIVIDSWNNIKKYINIKDAYFIFDEDHLVGSGAWVKAFYKIAKNNKWVILSASPADCWKDYTAVFVANGFYANKTEYEREHFVYSRFSKFPQIERYVNTERLIRLRNKILIDVDFTRHTIPHHEDVYCSYDICKYKEVMKTRWDPYKNEPIQQASGLCYVLRRIVNESEDRVVKLLEILEDHQKVIIFYSFNYEREILLHVLSEFNIDGKYFDVAEWSGHAHEEIPDSNRWIYLVQ